MQLGRGLDAGNSETQKEQETHEARNKYNNLNTSRGPQSRKESRNNVQFTLTDKFDRESTHELYNRGRKFQFHVDRKWRRPVSSSYGNERQHNLRLFDPIGISKQRREGLLQSHWLYRGKLLTFCVKKIANEN